MKLLQLYRVYGFNRPLGFPEPALGETLPRHADMLRYDVAFHDPKDPSLIMLPYWNTPHGGTSRKITWGRWDSFSLRLEAIPHTSDIYISSLRLDEWVTYRHPDTDYVTLVAETFKQFQERNKKYKLAGYR